MQDLQERRESDELRPFEWWLVSPATEFRTELALAISRVGQRIMRLGNRIDDCAYDGDEHEAWGKGFEIGRQLGRPEPSRADVEHLLTRLGFDTTDETMAKFGYAPASTVGGAS
ncbi:hypothetical protein [Terrabacter sp. BE26]|uniref:hypothetical protein n=1 Tax=Terrabacter sp. BE26 TaxID=2898152 RepID=UPI0035BE1B1D